MLPDGAQENSLTFQYPILNNLLLHRFFPTNLIKKMLKYYCTHQLKDMLPKVFLIIHCSSNKIFVKWLIKLIYAAVKIPLLFPLIPFLTTLLTTGEPFIEWGYQAIRLHCNNNKKGQSVYSGSLYKQYNLGVKFSVFLITHYSLLISIMSCIN